MRIKLENYLSFCFRVSSLPALLLLALILGNTSSARAASFTVNTNYDANNATALDNNPGDGVCQQSLDGMCSLRAAMTEVSALGGSNTINFNVPFSLLTLKAALPPVSADLTIVGPGAANLTLDGGALVRHFFVNAGAKLTISDLKLSGGVSDSGGSIYNSGGTLLITSVVFNGNNTTTTAGMPHFGGAIYNDGTLTMSGSSFSNNVATISSCPLNLCHIGGGGFYVSGSASAEVSNTVFNNNSDSIWNEGSVTVTTSSFTNSGITNTKILSVSDSTFIGNSVGIGTSAVAARTTVNRSLFTQGGVALFTTDGELIVSNSTFVNNSESTGTGIIGKNEANISGTFPTVKITNSTIANNTGYGIFGTGSWTIRNTIIAGSSIRNCKDFPTNGGNNIEDGTGCGWGSNNGSQSSVNPQLGALGNFGGPTQTMPLIGNSPAVNKGNPAICAAAVGAPDYGAGAVDQRSFARRNGFCDVGAFEAQPSNISGQGSGQSTLVNTPFASLLRVHVTDFFANVLGGSSVTFSGPGSGASIATGGTANTDANGDAGFAATANGIGGSYKVVAGFAGGPLVNFDLTNTGGATPTPTASPTPTPTPTATPTPTPSPTPTATPTPMLIQFSASTYQVAEADGRVDTIITRSGDTSLAASVSFATSDLAGVQNCNLANGVASARCDYETRLTTVRFAAGETAKVVTVLIIDDSYLEGPETFSVNLSNPVGGSLGANANATVTIVDNDLATGASPINQTNFFVRMHYLDFLNRLPDNDGIVFWSNEILSCGSNQACIDAKRINVSAAFFLSIEFQQTGYLVERTYKSAYGSATGTSTLGGAHQLSVPVVQMNEFLADSQQIAEGVIVGQSNWQQTLENNKQAFFAVFVQRSRFTSAFPNSLSAAQFVDALNANAENPLSVSERNQLVNDLATGGKNRAQVLRAIAENSNLAKAEFNRALVLMQYFGYLRRNPNDSPDSDHTGYEFWLTKLTQFNGDFAGAEMVKAFLNSVEYRQRFGTP